MWQNVTRDGSFATSTAIHYSFIVNEEVEAGRRFKYKAENEVLCVRLWRFARSTARSATKDRWITFGMIWVVDLICYADIMKVRSKRL